jgi:septal ring factor EnvC (AmiA/AmiB activator)
VIPERESAPRPSQATDQDVSWLQRELEESHKTIRSLLRQVSKEQARHAEIARAYEKTVANLMEITRENAQLERERDQWKARAEGAALPFQIGGETLELTPAEVSAIRKAMARLHHPDTGGDVERMKRWNAALDPLDR